MDLGGELPSCRRSIWVDTELKALQRQFSIIAATVYGNRGAEAMLCTVVGLLHEQAPDTHFHVFSYYPKGDRARVSADHVTIHSATPVVAALKLFPLALLFGLLRRVFGKAALRMAPRSIRALGCSEALVDLAGVAFIDGREKFLPYNVLTLLPAILLGVPVVKMPQAMGPFRSRWNRLAAGFTLPSCRKIWARGDGTYANLEQSGIKGLHFGLGDDVAFNYTPAWSLSQERPASFGRLVDGIAASRTDYKGVIGLCPSSVVAASATRTGVPYEPVMVDLVTGLACEGFMVVMFPNATRQISGDKGRNNDLPLIRRIRAGVKDAGMVLDAAVRIVDADINTASIKELISMLDVALVSRFHAMVGALSLGIPVTVLGWSHKYLEVMARFGLESQVLDYTRSAERVLREKVVETFESRQRVRASILEHLPEVKASARRPVIELLLPGRGSEA